MKRILLVGSVGCGKTTLLQRLNDVEIVYAKTQSITSDGEVTDTPGEYLELSFYRHALRMASFEVDLVLLLEAANATYTRLPPAFTTFFAKPTIGVVTKIDLGTPREVAFAAEHLRMAGASEVFEICSMTGAGIDELVARIS